MDLNNLLYKHTDKIEPGRGKLLIAEPMMEEVFFRRSVVLLLDEDTDGGLLGLTLNKTTELTLHDIMPELGFGEDITVYCGGPVDMERLFMLHTMGDTFGECLQVSPGLYVGGDFHKIVDYLKSGGEVEGKIRFFIGYSGWRGGQLADEIENHSWAVGIPEGGEILLQSEENEFRRREVSRL
ncbi:MAG: YqgE/AlgH family protein [Muribaculaceae bacterium]|nr:YqgE/AlgH family protein [Muribaculaceae bacterium]